MTLKAVMLWNEPNNLSHWDFTLDPDWSIFARMCRYASEAIRAEAPHLPLVLGGIAPLDAKFVDLVMNDHGLEHVLDAVGVHGFPFDWHLWQIDEWPQELAAIRAKTNRPLWATEVGMSSFGAEEVQVIGLKKTIEILPPLVDEIFWYTLFDLPQTRKATTRHKEAEGSSYFRHFYFGLLTEDGRPKQALEHFPPEFGICQWLFLEEYEKVDATVSWLRKLGVKSIRTGLSWADWHVPGATDFFDYMMRALDEFEVTATLCFTPPSRGIRADHTSPPQDPGEFAYFCEQMVRRYK
ncbi:MAG TPA: beta-xylosidase [Chloroflexota bacterium]|nr:beta-xylosidase [Chloroflexota bacterium]